MNDIYNNLLISFNFYLAYKNQQLIFNYKK